MKTQLEYQLRCLRQPISLDLARRVNTHWQIGETLNGIRKTLLDLLDSEMRATFEGLIAPIEIRRDAPYTVASQDALRLCDQLLSLCIEDSAAKQVDLTQLRPSTTSVGRLIPQTRKVFVIHGHDASNTLRLRNLLKERFGLQPVVLAELPSKGRALIEKFEEEAADVSFAFALVTPDDLVRVQANEYSQARPNVIFELGWFYGRLGRDRVCILFREGSKIHSDLDGVLRIQFRESVEEKLGEIEKELEAAGLIKGQE